MNINVQVFKYPFLILLGKYLAVEIVGSSYPQNLKKCILLIMLLQFSQYSPFAPLCAVSLFPPAIPPPHSSRPWVMHISSLASPFPILFLTSPYLFCAYQLCFLSPVPFFLIIHLYLPLPTNSPPSDLHFCDSVPVLDVCLGFFLSLFFKIQLLIVVKLSL